MNAPEQILLLILTFFGQPVMYMNASPYLTVEACNESGKLLELSDARAKKLEAEIYCEWRDKTPEAMPDLTGDFTPEQLLIIEDGLNEFI